MMKFESDPNFQFRNFVRRVERSRRWRASRGNEFAGMMPFVNDEGTSAPIRLLPHSKVALASSTPPPHFPAAAHDPSDRSGKRALPPAPRRSETHSIKK
jgi:hypothetical protein